MTPAIRDLLTDLRNMLTPTPGVVTIIDQPVVCARIDAALAEPDRLAAVERERDSLVHPCEHCGDTGWYKAGDRDCTCSCPTGVTEHNRVMQAPDTSTTTRLAAVEAEWQASVNAGAQFQRERDEAREKLSATACEGCGGEGGWERDSDAGGMHSTVRQTCDRCHGTGSELDALRRDVAMLRAVNDVAAENYAKITKDRDEARATLAAMLGGRPDPVVVERDTLRAERDAALRKAVVLDEALNEVIAERNTLLDESDALFAYVRLMESKAVRGALAFTAMRGVGKATPEASAEADAVRAAARKIVGMP